LRRALGAKPFRARQLMKWIYRRGAADFSSMTDLSQDFRSQLSEVARIAVPEIVAEQVSSDGTRKWMLRMDEVQGIETVYIPEPDRGTLCISSQVGCAMDCSFCSTAQQGFNRNLSVAEIVGQVWLAHRELPRTPREVTTLAVPLPDAAAPAATSLTSSSWAWVNRSPTTAMWCRRCAHSSTIWDTTYRAAG